MDRAGNIGHAVQDSPSVARRIQGDFWGKYQISDDTIDIARLLAPVVPPMIICVGANYRLHGDEVGGLRPQRPLIFFKGINTLQDPGQPVSIPCTAGSSKIDYEAELAVVIGKRCRNATAENALDYVLGYTCANDISARDWQLEWGEGQWARGKSFDTFCPLGPCVVTKDEFANPHELSIETTVNGTTVQKSNTRLMIFDIPTLIAFISQDTTLPPGTVILTGTPEGVGMARKPPLWLNPGDTVTVGISGIGELSNEIVAGD